MTTIETVSKQSPELLVNEIDKRIVKVRPMSTPLDQISRWGGARHSGSMIVDYYSVDTKPMTAVLKKTGAVDSDDIDLNSDYIPASLKTDNNRIFQPTDTILVPSVTVNDKNEALILYVYGISESNGDVFVIAVNNRESDGKYRIPAALKSGAELVRMGRAATELDVQTPQFESIPVKTSNYCQIFKTQIEQSTMLRLANKEVGWDFNDQEEAAIIDMRLGMEKSFLFGTKCRFTDPIKRDEVMLTGGIWNQTSNEWTYPNEKGFTKEAIVGLMRQAFTKNAGSSRKILIGGSELLECIQHLVTSQKFLSSHETITKWGISFTDLVTKFGTLYVVLSETFDQCGRPGDGMIIDPEYITKYCHIPFNTEKLDLRSSGVRNTEALVLTEASCLVLRYPQAHMRIVRTETPAAEA